jgi:hypothetical protein
MLTCAKAHKHACSCAHKSKHSADIYTNIRDVTLHAHKTFLPFLYPICKCRHISLCSERSGHQREVANSRRPRVKKKGTKRGMGKRGYFTSWIQSASRRSEIRACSAWQRQWQRCHEKVEGWRRRFRPNSSSLRSGEERNKNEGGGDALRDRPG